MLRPTYCDVVGRTADRFNFGPERFNFSVGDLELMGDERKIGCFQNDKENAQKRENYGID